jgi:hypothetical protein
MLACEKFENLSCQILEAAFVVQNQLCLYSLCFKLVGATLVIFGLDTHVPLSCFSLCCDALAACF